MIFISKEGKESSKRSCHRPEKVFSASNERRSLASSSLCVLFTHFLMILLVVVGKLLAKMSSLESYGSSSSDFEEAALSDGRTDGRTDDRDHARD